jgi:hypothetical protein
MKTTKKRIRTFLTGMFGIVLALLPVLSACGQSVSGRYTGESERTRLWSGGLISFEFDGGIAKVMSINGLRITGRQDEPRAVPYKVNGKHITIEIPLNPLVLEIKDGNTLEGIGSPIDGKQFLKSVGGFDYLETNKDGKRGVTITNYSGTNPVVTIPAKIRNLPVTTIWEYAFSEKHLTGVTIPDSITTIKRGAFATNQLTAVTIPDSITTIEFMVFAENQLTAIVIPDSVTTIERYAFEKNQLTSIAIGRNVDIGDITDTPVKFDMGAFNEDFTRYYNDKTWKRAGVYTLVNGRWNYALHNKQDIKISGDFEYKENNIDGKRGITITHYTGTNPALTIPAKINNLPVTAIGESALCPYIELRLDIGERFDSEAAFIEEVGKAPIKTALTSVTIPSSVTTIGDSAFYGNQLTSVTIPDSVTTIGDLAFYENQLTSVTIPDSVTTIGYGAFAGNQLTSVTIPESVTSIGTSAFAGNQLTSITIDNNATFDGSAFDNDFKKYYDSNGKKAGTYTFANGRWSAVYR